MITAWCVNGNFLNFRPPASGGEVLHVFSASEVTESTDWTSWMFNGNTTLDRFCVPAAKQSFMAYLCGLMANKASNPADIQKWTSARATCETEAIRLERQSRSDASVSQNGIQDRIKRTWP
jgi:hypothetical protein